ncbi:MAG: hypothetical protein SGI89_15385 [bacterium]|nr:hypothetical protein [bacterium]
MKKLSAVILLLILFISGCNKDRPETVVKDNSKEKMTIKKDTTITVRKELITKNGKTFTIIESKPTITVSNYFVTGTGFKNSSDTITFSLLDPMLNALLADLDNNGFEELYIITKSTGDEAFVNVMGVVSDMDERIAEIKIQQDSSMIMNKGDEFNGYLGMDSVYFDRSHLYKEYPVFKSSDPGSGNISGKVKMTYTLKNKNSEYSLDVTEKQKFPN